MIFSKRRTLQFLIQSASAGHAQSTYELFEVDSSIFVRVEYVENIVGEFSGIAKGKELFVYFTEFGLVELA